MSKVTIITFFVLATVCIQVYSVPTQKGNNQGCNDVCQKECIQVHNKYRANHGAPPLIFEQRLADQAQAHIKKGVMVHSDWVKSNGGESIAWGSIFPSFTSAIKSWHDERINFDHDTGRAKSDGNVVRHYAQLVWKGVHRLGCARGSLYGKPWYVVHYDAAPALDKPEAIKENIGKPQQDDTSWFRDGSPFSKAFENPNQV